MKEAKKFAQHLKKLHKDVSQWTRTMDGKYLVFIECHLQLPAGDDKPKAIA